MWLSWSIAIFWTNYMTCIGQRSFFWPSQTICYWNFSLTNHLPLAISVGKLLVSGPLSEQSICQWPFFWLNYNPLFLGQAKLFFLDKLFASGPLSGQTFGQGFSFWPSQTISIDSFWTEYLLVALTVDKLDIALFLKNIICHWPFFWTNFWPQAAFYARPNIFWTKLFATSPLSRQIEPAI